MSNDLWSPPMLKIKKMTTEDLNVAIDWAAEEGWNPGFHDAESYYRADPNGFLMGLINNEPVGCISVVKYSDTFAFLGFYMVKPEYRGQGYGIQIWNAGLEYLAGCNIGLDGVADQQENYRKSGFKLAYGNVRFEGKGGGASADHTLGDRKIISLSQLPVDEILAYDRLFFPAEREAFTQSWIHQADGHALAILDKGGLSGYGVIRQCREGYKIAPLYADSPELANTLFLALKAKVKDTDSVYLDVPNVNSNAVSLAKRYNMTPCFETARMYTGEAPILPLDRTYGVTSFEIG